MRITRTNTGYTIALTPANADDILAESQSVDEETTIGELVRELRLVCEVDELEEDDGEDNSN